MREVEEEEEVTALMFGAKEWSRGNEVWMVKLEKEKEKEPSSA